jgi:alpha-L-glutamate ligase-like protein/uncharacterized protein (TIGR02421 family)
MSIFSSHGILGINARNLLYIKPYNPEKAIKLADDKIKTKRFLSSRGVPVPRLINAIKNREELDRFDFDSLPSAFVLKPNCGFGGEGIIPIANKRDKYWVTVNGEKITKDQMYRHILDILDGRFSISSSTDIAFFEQLLITHESISPYAYEGLPDIRVIVYNLVPVMAMLRLPTKESRGKANLHQGAIGVGIDIATGKTTHIARKNKIIDEIPGVGKLENFQIPFWDEILLIASRIQLCTNLGYLAADIALDKNVGPVLLEINARAGLGVQVANLAPLRKRLEKVEGIQVGSPEKGVRIAKDMFGRTIEKEIENISGKEVIGSREDVEIILKKGIHKVKAIIDPALERSAIDATLAGDLGFMDSEDYNDEKSTLKLKFSLKNKRIQTVMEVENIPDTDCKMIIGARDLKDFLIDPSATKTKKGIRQKKLTNYFEIDQEIVNIDNKIKLLFHLRPVNLKDEQNKFLKNFSYNPQFTYPELRFDPDELRTRLSKIEVDDSSPLGQIFFAKKAELIKKIELIESIDTVDFTEKSIALFGEPSKELVGECEKMLIEREKSRTAENEDIPAEKAKEEFEKVFGKYGLRNWKVKLKKEMVTDCVAGKNNMMFVKESAKFSEKRLQNLIIHEVETHILTAENGKNQPFEIFNRGLADYLITQEGLAMYNVSKQTGKSIKDNFRALALVIAADIATRSSFVETFEKILSYGIPIDQAVRITLKVKRGLADTGEPGAFTKDILYYKGFKEISEFVADGGRIKELYIGKLNIKDLELIRKIEGLLPPVYLPEWL